MKTAPIVPARISFNEDGLPFSPEYGDVYHPRSGALGQARHVFLRGNALPHRWQGRERFVALETGFGLGNNFLATWDAWRSDPQHCRTLHFISIEQHPLRRADLATLHRGSPLAGLADQLVQAWPPLTCNLHRLAFDNGQVQLLLALGDVAAWLPELVAQVDAFFLDGFAPAKNPGMWQPRLFKALGRLAAPGATLATWTAARAVREGLAEAGFEVSMEAGSGGKRDITVARFAPSFMPRRALARARPPAGGDQRAVIVGAGLAGCAAAAALAEQGWHCTVLDRHAAIAQEASGNIAGLFHGIVNAQDGAHARFNRAAALVAHPAVLQAVGHHGVPGSVEGVLRLETKLSDSSLMRAVLDRLGLPADYAQALDAAQASQLCGLPMKHAAWFYPGAGWVQPAGLARSFVEQGGGRVNCRGGVHVVRLRHGSSAWQLFDAQGTLIDEARTVVLANASDAWRLLAPLGQPHWPLETVRGQVSTLGDAPFALPRIPIAGAGYLLPEVNGQAVFGATSQAGDDDPAVRTSDHRHNLAQLARLLGHDMAVNSSDLRGRTAWRCVSGDRLPIIGAVPDALALELAAHTSGAPARMDQPRFVPRRDGLFVFTALASRGITWAALGARVLASTITGSPGPLEASLLDAVDPARFAARAARRTAAEKSAG